MPGPCNVTQKPESWLKAPVEDGDCPSGPTGSGVDFKRVAIFDSFSGSVLPQVESLEMSEWCRREGCWLASGLNKLLILMAATKKKAAN